MPDLAARRSILAIHSRHWQPQPPPKLLDDLAQQTGGYCGADLRVGFPASAEQCCLRWFQGKRYTCMRKHWPPAILVDGAALEGAYSLQWAARLHL